MVEDLQKEVRLFMMEALKVELSALGDRIEQSVGRQLREIFPESPFDIQGGVAAAAQAQEQDIPTASLRYSALTGRDAERVRPVSPRPLTGTTFQTQEAQPLLGISVLNGHKKGHNYKKTF